METVLRTIHHASLPKRTRAPDQPFEVIACGLGRSGTASLMEALGILGICTYHGQQMSTNPSDGRAWVEASETKWEGKGPVLDVAFWDSILGEHTGIADIPAAAFAPELMAAYPDAKVILNIRRDVDGWYESCVRCVLLYIEGSRFWDNFHASAFWFRRVVRKIWDPMFRRNFKVNGRRVYQEHNAMIRGMAPKDRFLEWHLGDGWGPLCKFLGKDVPDVPFPRGNSSAELVPKLKMVLLFLKLKACLIMGIGIGLMAVLGKLGAQYQLHQPMLRVLQRGQF